MASKPKSAVFNELVGEGLQLRNQIAGLLAELQIVQNKLIALGAGNYCDDRNNECTVVAATESKTGAICYVLPDDGEAKARELASDSFGDLFDRKVIFTPCQGFELVAPKLLTPAKARDIVNLCLVPGKTIQGKAAYVKWK